MQIFFVIKTKKICNNFDTIPTNRILRFEINKMGKRKIYKKITMIYRYESVSY